MPLEDWKTRMVGRDEETKVNGRHENKCLRNSQSQLEEYPEENDGTLENSNWAKDDEESDEEHGSVDLGTRAVKVVTVYCSAFES